MGNSLFLQPLLISSFALLKWNHLKLHIEFALFCLLNSHYTLRIELMQWL